MTSLSHFLNLIWWFLTNMLGTVSPKQCMIVIQRGHSCCSLPQWCCWVAPESESGFPFHMSQSKVTNLTTPHTHMYLKEKKRNSSVMFLGLSLLILTVAVFWDALEHLNAWSRTVSTFIARARVGAAASTSPVGSMAGSNTPSVIPLRPPTVNWTNYTSTE